ncbi:MAG: hypothetical protein WD271_01035 [Acidimicrobiia bacterium]
MSIPVELRQLHEAIDDTDRAPYLLTVSDDGRPHSVAVDFTWHGDELELSVGNRTLEYARARALVSVLWPPKEPTGYSLIVDADVTHTSGTGNGDNMIRIRPTRAVLHRPAAVATENA